MKFECNHCGQSLEADSDMAGTSEACPTCSKEVRVPIPKDQPIRVQRATPPLVPPQPVSHASPLNTGLQPRSYLGTASMIFGVTALPFALLAGWLMSSGTGTPFGAVLVFTIPGGLMFGLLFGLTMAAFLKGVTITVNVRDKDEFVSQINVAMSQIGFNPATASGNFLTFKPSFQAGLLSGNFSVAIQGNKATIVGPGMYVKKLQKCLG